MGAEACLGCVSGGFAPAPVAGAARPRTDSPGPGSGFGEIRILFSKFSRFAIFSSRIRVLSRVRSRVESRVDALAQKAGFSNGF